MKRNFDSFVKSFLEYNEHLGVSRKFVLWSAISGIAGCLERKAWVVYNGTQIIYPNLFIMLIADSGIANKSTASRPIMDLLYQVPGLSFMSTQMSGASLIKQMSKAGEANIFQYDNVSYKNSSLFSYSSEAKVTIGDAKGMSGVQELLTDFYDCGDPNTWSNKKGWNKETLSGGSITVWNPCLNLLYCSTPAWLLEALGKNGIAGGFASRVLFVNEKERFRGNQGWIEDEQEGHDSKLREKLVEDLTQISKFKGRFKTAFGFGETYNQLLEKRNAKLDADPKGDMAAYYSRKMWHLLKLSQVFSANESNAMIITPDHLLMANEALESLEADMYDPFLIRGDNKNLSSMNYVWEVMRRKKNWTLKELQASCFKHASITQLHEHLRTFLAMEVIKTIPAADNKMYYQVTNPAPLSATK